MAIRYQSLEATDAFRLVVLLPGAHGEDIHCNLIHTAHTANPDYEALSYAWGSTENMQSCYINGESCAIRENLWQALQHLRSEWQERVLWIDAISINQTDVAERNHQVGQMRSIYSFADTVIVWLGKSSETSDVAMKWMDDSALQHRNALGIRGRLGVTSTKRIIQDQVDRWNALQDLCGREYWQRLWIVQEVVLARRIKIHCGEEEVKWEGLTNLLDEFDLLFKPRACKRAARQVKMSLAAQLHALRNMHSMRGCTLETLVEATRTSLCSDPRDKIYALLGLAADHQSGKIQIDYAKGVPEVYAGLWKFYVGDSAPNTVLHGCQSLQRLLQRDDIDCENGAMLSRTRIDIAGYVVGKAIYVGQPWKDQNSATEWNEVLHGMTGKVDRQYQRFCNTLCGTTYADVERIGLLTEARASRLNSQFAPSLVDSHTSEENQSLKEVTETAAGSDKYVFWDDDEYRPYRKHCVIVSSTGQMGLAPLGACVGDEICQFQDTDVTTLVRSTISGSVDGNRELIGKALLARRWDEPPRLTGIQGEVYKYGVLEDDLAFQCRRQKSRCQPYEDGLGTVDRDIVQLSVTHETLRWLTSSRYKAPTGYVI